LKNECGMVGGAAVPALLFEARGIAAGDAALGRGCGGGRGDAGGCAFDGHRVPAGPLRPAARGHGARESPPPQRGTGSRLPPPAPTRKGFETTAAWPSDLPPRPACALWPRRFTRRCCSRLEVTLAALC